MDEMTVDIIEPMISNENCMDNGVASFDYNLIILNYDGPANLAPDIFEIKDGQIIISATELNQIGTYEVVI